ncbi:MAG: Uncharacterized protein LiPW15_86 [Parcubacteria group bacterium LiPW_15]|nr:MAG: Uncharacterized protein LiPW15_86 [Parcubacteria group bacterium LiPW_15]
MKPLGKVNLKWSPDFAYALGLLATDGNLSLDGRHIDLTSKDNEQLGNFLRCLKIANKIGSKYSGSGRKYFRVQIGDINFYKFLLNVGFMPAKSKIISKLDIPDKYFFDFLRGHFDGDGTFYSYRDARWRNSFMFYTVFVSASMAHLKWLRNKLFDNLDISGHISSSKNRSAHELRYAKAESLKLLPKLYYNPLVICLSRKRNKVEGVLASQGKKL